MNKAEKVYDRETAKEAKYYDRHKKEAMSEVYKLRRQKLKVVK